MGEPVLRGLMIDWGGVLTEPLDDAMARWAQGEGVDYRHFRELLHSWSGADHRAADRGPGGDHRAAESHDSQEPVLHRVERGRLPIAQFEQRLAAGLAERGSPVAPAGLLSRVLGDLDQLDDDMIAMIRRARAAGIRTALVSNSWGEHYPDALWDNLFDAVVISGRVGLRKPDREMYERSAAALGLPASACVMVDDLARNVHGAVAAGMVAVHHVSYRDTVTELEALFGVPLRPAGGPG